MSASDHIESLPFNVSATDLKRQAVDTWRGYEYQLNQALHAWLKLPEHASLYLEIAEDHAVLTEAQLEQTQVKDLASNITLRSEAARALLESHWRLLEANPELQVVSTLLTTAEAGKEANIVFADNKPGLEHWRTVAREGTDVKPLRDFLLTLALSDSLKAFILQASDEELRNRLIRPIKWLYASGDLETMIQLTNESLVYLGDRYGLLASESVRTRDILLGELRNVILKKSIRAVTRADLLQAFEDATHVSVPRAVADNFSRPQTTTLGQLAINAHAGAITEVCRMPLPPRVASRIELVAKMATLAATKGVLWLHGSSGLGKTTLSLMLGKHTKESWIFVDLRNCSVQEVKYRLAIAAQYLAGGLTRGVIVDDFPVDNAQATLLNLAQLKMEAQLQDATMVVTTSRVPPPSVVSRLGEDSIALEELPYLSEDDVGELIAKAGGDPEKWTEIVHHFSSGGHPRIVDVRIVSLRTNNWADSECLKDVAPLFASKEMQAEIEAVSVQLSKLLPENALELLYRLSFLMNGFDKQLAMSVGEANEAIKRSGEAFNILIGPWVECRGENKYSLSPLISNLGSTVFAGNQQSIIRKAIVKDLMQRHPFPAEHLCQLLINAFIEKVKPALLWIAEAIQLSAIRDRNEFKLLAREVSIFFTALPTHEPLFKDDNYVAAMLRITQCFVALETEPERFFAIFDRMIEECRQITDKRISAGLLVMCLFKIFTRQGIGLSPKKWLPLIMEFPQLLRVMGEQGKAFAEIGKDSPQDWTVDKFLFVCQASSLPNVESLSDLMHILDELDVEKRDYFLSALNADVRARRLTIDNAWVNQAKVEELNGVWLSDKYKGLAEIAESWGEKNLQIDCICAQAVLLDEYASDSDKAIVLLDDAIKTLGDNHQLLRRRQVVLVHQGRHEEALETLPKIISGNSSDAVDFLYSLRDAGRSAAETEKLSESRRYFCEAASIAANQVSQHLIPLAAGLLADAAYVALLQSDYEGCLDLLKRAIIKAESIGPEPTDSEKFCLIILGGFSAWMFETVQQGISNRGWKAGICSNPNPHPDILKRNIPQPLMLWYQLANMEAMLGVDAGALSELKGRLAVRGSGYQGFEVLLSSSLISRAIKNVDVSEFLRLLPEFLTLSALPRPKDDSMPVAITPVTVPIVPIEPKHWSDSERCLLHLKNATIAFALQAISCDKEPRIDELLKAMELSFSLGTEFTAFLKSLGEVRIFQPHDFLAIGATCVANLREAKERISAGMALGLTYYLWGWLVESEFKQSIENSLAECVSSIWHRIITQSRFTLSNPAMNVPHIKSILEGPTKGAPRLALLALETESATSSSLDEDIRRELRDYLYKANQSKNSSAI
ncbi:MAG: hypothetical protein IPK73_08180 [Candidatus Obscuribacter sp.]|nr:hypothetical protein [Candidatus Obscuribacter sp.]MBK9279580.1 hypothetical protein [Candidatus Obscuribacter sp.]